MSTHSKHDADAPSGPRAERRAVSLRHMQRASQAGLAQPCPDQVAVEEPLEIRIATDTLATIMRTPGEDHFLVAGFLYSEGIISGLGDLGRIAHCGRPDAPDYGNLIDVAPGPGLALAPELTRLSARAGVVGSSCGVCGRQSIDDLVHRIKRVDETHRIASSHILHSVEILRARQSGFERTGATHAALALSRHGQDFAFSEDVGRHNAVDKVIGKLLYDGRLSDSDDGAALLAVSGRASFEIVQKAAMARLFAVISISAPTSLAIDLARAAGILLAGFTRGPSFNVYSCPQRIAFV